MAESASGYPEVSTWDIWDIGKLAKPPSTARELAMKQRHELKFDWQLTRAPPFVYLLSDR